MLTPTVDRDYSGEGDPLVLLVAIDHPDQEDRNRRLSEYLLGDASQKEVTESLRPWVPMTIKSAPTRSTYLTISVDGTPCSIVVVASTPASSAALATASTASRPRSSSESIACSLTSTSMVQADPN